MQEDFPGGVDPDFVGSGDGLVIVLEADQYVAGLFKGKHHGQRGPALLPFQPGERGASIGQQVGEHAAHRGVGLVLLHGLDQSGKVGGDLFLVHVFVLDVGKTDGVFVSRRPQCLNLQCFAGIR